MDSSAERQAHADIINNVLKLAREQGATSAEAEVGTGKGLAVTARLGEVETPL